MAANHNQLKTLGISPKLYVAVIVAVITYYLGQNVVEIAPGLEVALTGVLVALGVYLAPPAPTYEADDPTDSSGLEHEKWDEASRVTGG